MPARKTLTSRQSFKQAHISRRRPSKSVRAKRHAVRENGETDQTPTVDRWNKGQRSGGGKHNTATKDASQRHGPRPGTKLAKIVAQLKQKGGATIIALSEAIGWQKHSVHGVISGTLRTKMGINVQTNVKDGVRYYRIAD